jgi:hypothetical protein
MMLQLSVLLLGLGGFAALALAMEKHSKHLLRRVLAARWRRVVRVAGWLLLALALALSMRGLGAGIGFVVWLGWLSVAALALVFYLPKWPWQPPAKARPARRPREQAAEVAALPVAARRHGGRWLAGGLLVATFGVFAGGLIAAGPQPLLRDDALQGSVGPWTFTFAEADRNPPEIVDMGVPLKAYRMRFCDACDPAIRNAYLKVNKPRSMRASGMAFEGRDINRGVEIQLPANLTAESELWLTVVGKDGAVHQTHWRMAEVSPATVAWFEQQRGKRKGV